jgi:hypothetical protein
MHVWSMGGQPAVKQSSNSRARDFIVAPSPT